MNKKIVTIMLTLTLCASMLPTTVEAKLFDIMRPGEEETTTNKSDAINIIKHLGISIDSSTDKVTSVGDSSANGDATQGHNGMSVAFAYLTPQKEFGLITRNDLDIVSGNGTNKKVSDPLGVWSKAATQTSNIRDFYDNAVDDFTTSSKIKSSINSVTKEDIIDSKVSTQVSDANREFIATTFYVRWFYDVISGRTSTSDMYMRELPVLEFYNGTSGPYIGWGDFFTATINVIPGSNYTDANYNENVARRKRISNNANKYIRGLSSVAKKGSVLTGTYLTSDPYYGGEITVQSYEPNNKALFEKSFEYRRYFDRGGDGNSSGDYYEIVYPVETYTTIKNESDATIGVLASVKSNTVFKDSDKQEVDRYEFKVKIEPFEPVTEGVKSLESPKTYHIEHDKNSSEIPSSPSGEPPENKADVWHEIISRELVIKDKNGKNVIDPIKLESNEETVTIYPEDVNNKSLGGYTVCVEVTYKTLSRYMKQKEMYTYSYHWFDGIDKTTVYEYSDIYTTLSTNTQVIQSGLSQIKEHHEKSEPKSIYIYETVGGDKEPQTTTVYDAIIGPNGTDPVSPTLSVDVNPPNALTVLEGGVFDINLTFDPKDISIGKETDETRVWIEDLKITPVIVTAQNGDVIYEHTTPIDGFTNEELSASIIGVTAKPTHIGKATVTVHYQYTLVEEVYNRDKIVDGFGNVTDGEEYLVRTDKTECKGKATGYFNIYSLTGVTSN